MAIIHVKEQEPFDVALRRFKRACEKAGILTRLRQLEFYEKPTSERKRKRSAAVKREQKRVMKDRGIFIPIKKEVKKPRYSKFSIPQ